MGIFGALDVDKMEEKECQGDCQGDDCQGDGVVDTIFSEGKLSLVSITPSP